MLKDRNVRGKGKWNVMAGRWYETGRKGGVYSNGVQGARVLRKEHRIESQARG